VPGGGFRPVEVDGSVSTRPPMATLRRVRA